MLIIERQRYFYTQGIPAEVMTEGILLEVFGLENSIVLDFVAGTSMCISNSPKTLLKQDCV